MSATEQLFRRRKGTTTKSESSTEAVDPADVVAPMCHLGSQVLESPSDEGSIAVSLNGFVYAIRISSHSNMMLARETFVYSLALMANSWGRGWSRPAVPISACEDEKIRSRSRFRRVFRAR
jgi:hypothetical protein